jgi:hypothetical protein
MRHSLVQRWFGWSLYSSLRAVAVLAVGVGVLGSPACSSSGNSDGKGGLSGPGPGGGGQGAPNPDPGIIIPAASNGGGTGGGPSPNGSGGPITGTETTCDGQDNDHNGIIDDVDVGKDGLCDCIHIGFFGDVASDAGTATGSFEAWLVARSGLIPIQHLAATETLTSAWLSNLQVLIVGGLKKRAASAGSNPAFSAVELAAFDDWVQNKGGGAVTLSGYTTSIADARPVSELLQHSGLSYDLNSVSGAGVISEDGPPVWLNEIATPDHPIVDGVKEVGIYFGYPVLGDGTVIFTGEGYNLGMAKQWGKGHVFAFSDEWITQDATWSGLAKGQQNPCQQECNEQQNICRISTEQCAQCETQPCSDPADTDITTCAKGCQTSCKNETDRCAMYTQQCATCTDGVVERAEATPRLWLNAIRWLTPDNQCKVSIPPRGGVQIL